MRHARLRGEVVRTARRLVELGLNRGTSGNVGARIGGGFLVTPSGTDPETMRPGDIVAMDFAGNVRGGLEPSTEWRFHRDIFAARPDVGAIVHVHAMFSTVLACLRRDIPAFHYMIAVAGGDSIRCASYATFGTQALSDRAVGALAGRSACLLANHGMIAVGATLSAAVRMAVEVETLAAQYWGALLVGKPPLLSKAEMRRVLARFASYGKPTAARGSSG